MGMPIKKNRGSLTSEAVRIVFDIRIWKESQGYGILKKRVILNYQALLMNPRKENEFEYIRIVWRNY